jgi:predicted nucleotidyltransferase
MKTETQSLWAATPEKIAEAVRRIVEAASPVRVILFGSQARGEAGRDSDVDLVVVERNVDNRYAEMVRLGRVLRGLLLPVDILVISAQDFDAWADTPGSVYRTARQEGRILYEAA